VCGLCRWPSSFHTMWCEEPLVLLPLLPRSNHAASSSLGPSPSSSPPPLLFPSATYFQEEEAGGAIVHEERERGLCWCTRGDGGERRHRRPEGEVLEREGASWWFGCWVLPVLVMWVKKPSSDRCTWSPSSSTHLSPYLLPPQLVLPLLRTLPWPWGIKQLGPNRRPCVLSRVIYLCKTETIAAADC
jgi:hypothetical protein